MLQTILKSYLKRLTNLSSRNRSLLLLNLTTEQFLDVHDLDFLQKNSSFTIIENLIAQKDKIILCDVQDPRYDRVNEVSKRLNKIARTENFIKEERGAEDLYVGYPMVQGKFSDGTVVRCPLLFFPVTLKKTNNQQDRGHQSEAWRLQLRDEPLTLNRSFVLAYSHFNEISIFDDVLEKSFEDYQRESIPFRTQLYEWLKSSPLNLNFNQDLFTNQLISFPKLSKSDLESTEKNGELKLFPQAVLGIFPQAGSYLVPDYEKLIEEKQPSDNLESLFPQAPSDIAAAIAREESLLTPFAVDASQENAILRIKQGESLVVQGPPGTGKSQLIANLVADFTAQGKQVLVVCQKRAALDVVHGRLARMGMNHFVANIHDFKNDRKNLYDQLAAQIENVDDYKRLNQSLDAIFLEKHFAHECRVIDRTSRELQEFKEALFDETIAGVSVKELYLSSSPNAPHFNIKEYFKDLKINQLDDFLKRFSSFFKYQNRLYSTTEKASNFWKNRQSFQHFTFAELPEFEKIIAKVSKANKQAITKISEITSGTIEREDLALIEAERETFKQIAEILENEQIFSILKENIAEKRHLTDTQIDEIQEEAQRCFEGEGIEITLKTEELTDHLQKIRKATDAKSGAMSGLVWGIFSKEKTTIEALTKANGLDLKLEDLKRLGLRIENRIALEKWWTEYSYLFDNQTDADGNSVWLRKGWRWFERNFLTLRKAVAAEKSWRKIKSISLKKWLETDTETFKTETEKMLKVTGDYQTQYIRWQQWLSEEQILALIEKQIPEKEIISYLKNNFDLMQESDQIKDSFLRNEWAIIEQTIEAESEDKVEVFLNSLKLAWIEHIETVHPILRGVSSLKISQLEEELQNSVLKKQELSREILLLKLREQTYQDLTINRLQNVVTYRDLKHQVTKKRSLWAVRRLLEDFSEEIFKLSPCWLTSPETVSAIFPLTKLFDLVIFDEASQCFAEQGIPALFRGKQVLIAGDSQQLQPSDLYRVRFENDQEDVPDLEVDSLLNLAIRYLPQTQLRGHYRSKSLDLIDFSNKHFYRNTLSLLPDFEEINQKNPAIHYIKIEGVWENSTNQKEAEKVLALVEKISAESPEKSIGIVTFNYKQQGLIQDLLENISLPARKIDEELLFVKNIENVQGDERDIIIFSVGYAADARGKVSAQFGSLNQAGGENRLNVAVTRARERIYVVSSILPNQLKVEETLNLGPKLLKEYLTYSLEVSEGKHTPQPFDSQSLNTKWLLKEQLLASQENLIKELPFADLTMKNGELYESLILTDDDIFYEGISPKETFAYVPIGLRAKGWKFERMFSREFWRK